MKESDLRPKNCPVLLAVPSPDGLMWRAWCPFCRVYHSHSPEPGHRVAHCGDRRGTSPFDETGYVLRLTKKYGVK
jgi:hypothetical protein